MKVIKFAATDHSAWTIRRHLASDTLYVIMSKAIDTPILINFVTKCFKTTL